MEISIRGLLLLVTILFFCYVGCTAALFTYIEEWTFFEGVYFTIVSFTTVGLGDYVPFKEASQHNSYESYQLLNLFVIIIGSVFTYILLNLLATIYKCMIHYLANQSSLVDNGKASSVAANKRREQLPAASGNEPLKTFPPKRKNGISRFSSISSSVNGTVESNPMGSFAAIQRAIDRIRSKAVEDNTARTNELKAVNTIEAILQNEYQKIQARQGSGPKARWHRAAAKARLSNRRRNSVYNSVILDTASIPNTNPNLESIISSRSLKHKSLSSISSKNILEKSFSNLSTKSLQETFGIRDALNNNNSTNQESIHSQIHQAAFNLKNFKECKSKLSITHEKVEDRDELGYHHHQDVLEKHVKETVSRRSTKSTYIPSDYEEHSHRYPHNRMHHLSPPASREATPRIKRRRSEFKECDENQSAYTTSNHNNNRRYKKTSDSTTDNDDGDTLTYARIMESQREERRRRSTKSTYLSSNSKSRTSSMELDDFQSPLQLHNFVQDNFLGDDLSAPNHLVPDDGGKSGRIEEEEGGATGAVLRNVSAIRPSHLQHHNHPYLHDNGREHQQRIGKVSDGLFFECPITVDIPFYTDDEVEEDEEEIHGGGSDLGDAAYDLSTMVYGSEQIDNDNVVLRNGGQYQSAVMPSVASSISSSSRKHSASSGLRKNQVYKSYGKNIIGHVV